jgi:hypothetical protein
MLRNFYSIDAAKLIYFSQLIAFFLLKSVKQGKICATLANYFVILAANSIQ